MPHDEIKIRDDVRAHLKWLALQSGHLSSELKIADQDSLFLSGFLDSLSALKMILFLEENYHLNLQGQLKIVDIDTVDAIIFCLKGA
jgi:acyl carrier protein